MRRSAIIATVLLAATPSLAAADGPDQYEISVRYETRSEGNGSSGSSSGSNLYSEVAYPTQGACRTRRFDGIDDPERKRPLADWQLPVEVRECDDQPPVIVNQKEMLARLDAFLAAAKVSREACGKHYFTWNVFKIECDPETVLDTVAGINLGGIPLHDGADYEVPRTGIRVTLALVETTPDGRHTFTSSGAIDPAFLRQEAANTIMVVTEIMCEAVTREQAIAQMEDYQFSGEAKIVLVDDPATGTITQTVTSDVREVNAIGEVETRWTETVVTRQRAGTAHGPDPS